MAGMKAQPGIMNIALYQGGEAKIAGHETVIKLSSNENPLGCSTDASAAFVAAGAGLNRYPPTDHAGLRAAIAEVHGLDAGRIICGAGSDQVLTWIAQGFSGPGDEIIHTEHGFSMYPILAHAAGATPVGVPERDRVVDVDAILGAVTDRTRVVFIANPGNPTGTMIGLDEVARLADGLPDGCLLVHDAAYAEYVDGFDGGAALVEARENVVMTRTFSKIHGLGGLRIGWGYGPAAVIDVMNRLREPFNLSVAQLDTAEAAMRDRDWVRHCSVVNSEQRARLTGALRQLGVACDDSRANFVLARFADEAEAGAADAALKAAGIIVRRVTGYGFPEGLRITVGDADENGAVIAALTAWREAAA